MNDLLARRMASATVDTYRKVMELAAHNIGVMETALTFVPAGRRDEYERLLELQCGALELMADDMLALSKAVEKDDAAAILLDSMKVGALGISLASLFYESRLITPHAGLKTFGDAVAVAMTDERRATMEAINDKKRVTDDEQQKVGKLNRELVGKFPRNRPRYDEIARQLDMNSGRVRYIVEGPRRKK